MDADISSLLLLQNIWVVYLSFPMPAVDDDATLTDRCSASFPSLLQAVSFARSRPSCQSSAIPRRRRGRQASSASDNAY